MVFTVSVRELVFTDSVRELVFIVSVGGTKYASPLSVTLHFPTAEKWKRRLLILNKKNKCR